MFTSQVDPKCPEFESKHASTLQLLCVDVTNLTAQLEQTAILSIIAFAEQLSNKLGEVAPTQPTEEKAALEPLQKVGDEMLDKKTQSKPLGKLKRKSLGMYHFWLYKAKDDYFDVFFFFIYINSQPRCGFLKSSL